MFLGKVGQKSIAFINHKPFHPGNLQNLEKVWRAEEEEAANRKAQKEALERRRNEVQIEELRDALRAKEQANGGFVLPGAVVRLQQQRPQGRKAKTRGKKRRRNNNEEQTVKKAKEESSVKEEKSHENN